MPKTKIVCTIGPSSDSKEMIEKLIQAGMNVARLNFSHGTHEEHRLKIEMIREISKKLNAHVAILQDLCGPKIRVGCIRDPGIKLEPGQTLILTSTPMEGLGNRACVSYEKLPQEVKPGDVVMLADGLMEMVVEKTTDTEVHCNVITGGILTSNKGINLPSGTISAPSITEKDKKDLAFGLDLDIDYVALSFVRSAKDINEVKNIIRNADKDTPVIAKIEKHEALKNIDDIIRSADGIMVARGDLGVEIPLETVPNIQKMLIRKTNNEGKPVIVATQMLRSMCESPRPTRAEANDVANAVLDGTDAVMLSEETASGRYPVKAVEFMAKIAESAEQNYPHLKFLDIKPDSDISASVAYAACDLADHLKVSAIVASTQSGFTAKLISSFRPKASIIALSPDIKAVRRLALYWGCVPVHVDLLKGTDDMFEKGANSALTVGHVAKGDLVIVTAGHPVEVAGTTNMIKVVEV
ncbi:MAG: pyruvate kinase [Proteobacteria bacterium]|nr:pyruvate kinase [Pseudomonadota bacterium]